MHLNFAVCDIPQLVVEDPTVHAILSKLNQNGYYAVLVGGWVRDAILGIDFYDYDILTNCPKGKLNDIIENAIVNHLDKSKFKVGDYIDIKCTENSLEEELNLRDFYENTLIADRHGRVYDLLNCMSYLRNNKSCQILHTIGKAFERFEQDATIILRLIRLTTHLRRSLPGYFFDYINQFPQGITSAPFGLYICNFDALFSRGEALTNWNILNGLNMAGILLPGATEKKFNCDLLPYTYFVHHKFQEIDTCSANDRKERYTTYHYFALLMLAELINIGEELSNQELEFAVETICNSFCNHYVGPFTEIEKICFKNGVSNILKEYYQEYTIVLPEYKDHLDNHYVNKNNEISQKKNCLTFSFSEKINTNKKKTGNGYRKRDAEKVTRKMQHSV